MNMEVRMNRKTYSCSIKKTPYKYPIAKKMAKLMLDGLDRNEVFHECFDNNYVEIDSLERRKEVTNVLYERLSALDDYLLKEFYNGDVTTSKFILVYAMVKTDPLFFDFMFEVYREALMGRKNYITMEDFDNYFNSRKEVDINFRSWTGHTLIHLARAFRIILIESGLGIKESKTIYVERMMVHPMVEEHIRLLGDTDYLKAILGGK